jgi:hypothetical protein
MVITSSSSLPTNATAGHAGDGSTYQAVPQAVRYIRRQRSHDAKAEKPPRECWHLHLPARRIEHSHTDDSCGG